MVYFNYWISSFWKNGIFRRIFKLQKNFENIRINRARTKTVLGFGLVILSLLLGNSAYQMSQRDALSEWEKNHPPSSKIWSGLLRAYGFTLITHPNQIEKLYRSLPISIQDQPQLWVGDLENWVALSTNEFFCISCEILPRTWNSQDKNWRTYHEIESRLEAMQKPSRPKKREEIYDPREIRY